MKIFIKKLIITLSIVISCAPSQASATWWDDFIAQPIAKLYKQTAVWAKKNPTAAKVAAVGAGVTTVSVLAYAGYRWYSQQPSAPQEPQQKTPPTPTVELIDQTATGSATEPWNNGIFAFNMAAVNERSSKNQNIGSHSSALQPSAETQPAQQSVLSPVGVNDATLTTLEQPHIPTAVQDPVNNDEDEEDEEETPNYNFFTLYFPQELEDNCEEELTQFTNACTTGYKPFAKTFIKKEWLADYSYAVIPALAFIIEHAQAKYHYNSLAVEDNLNDAANKKALFSPKLSAVLNGKLKKSETVEYLQVFFTTYNDIDLMRILYQLITILPAKDCYCISAEMGVHHSIFIECAPKYKQRITQLCEQHVNCIKAYIIKSKNVQPQAAPVHDTTETNNNNVPQQQEMSQPAQQGVLSPVCVKDATSTTLVFKQPSSPASAQETIQMESIATTRIDDSNNLSADEDTDIESTSHADISIPLPPTENQETLLSQDLITLSNIEPSVFEGRSDEIQQEETQSIQEDVPVSVTLVLEQQDIPTTAQELMQAECTACIATYINKIQSYIAKMPPIYQDAQAIFTSFDALKQYQCITRYLTLAGLAHNIKNNHYLPLKKQAEDTLQEANRYYTALISKNEQDQAQRFIIYIWESYNNMRNQMQAIIKKHGMFSNNDCSHYTAMYKTLLSKVNQRYKEWKSSLEKHYSKNEISELLQALHHALQVDILTGINTTVMCCDSQITLDQKINRLIRQSTNNIDALFPAPATGSPLEQLQLVVNHSKAKLIN